MKRFGVIFVWTMATVLLIAVSVTAVSDRLALVPLTTEAVTTTSTEQTLIVNLNTATAEELQQLQGVGEVLSGRIIAYREEHAEDERYVEYNKQFEERERALQDEVGANGKKKKRKPPKLLGE